MNKINTIGGGRGTHPAFDTLYHRQTTLTKRQCELVVEQHPYLQTHIPERRLFWYLARKSTWKDKESGNIILPYKTLARFLEVSSHHGTEKLLQSFQEHVLPSFAWRNYYRQNEKCRQATYTGVHTAWNTLLSHYEGTLHYLDTFAPRSSRSLQEVVRTLKKEVKTFPYPYKEQQRITNYLHTLPLKLFLEPLERHFAEAYRVALQRSDDLAATSTLLDIRDIPFPFYFPSAKEGSITPRIFGKGIPLLPKEIRKILYPHWYDLDMKNCQIAIVAGILGIGEVQNFLATGASIWESILDFMLLVGEERLVAKSVFKEGAYSIVFGMNPANVEGNITKGLATISIEKKRKFLDHPLIKIISEAVTLAKEKILFHQGMQGAFGWIPYHGEDLNSFLSCVIQSYELILIGTCYNVAIKEKESRNKMFDITLQQHDGICIQMRDENAFEVSINRLKRALEEESNKYNIITTLE